MGSGDENEWFIKGMNPLVAIATTDNFYLKFIPKPTSGSQVRILIKCHFLLSDGCEMKTFSANGKRQIVYQIIQRKIHGGLKIRILFPHV